MDSPLTISEKPKPTLHPGHLTIGCLIFAQMDQIDFTGPFEVLSRIPDSTVHVMAKTQRPIRDIQGLILTPEIAIANAPRLDVLLVPGGYGQRELMEDDEVLSLIRAQADSGRLVLSVCTGALLCGAAGILQGRMATTHWAAWDLLYSYGARPTKSRVVVDGNVVTAAGVTAGLDGALVVASLLRGEATAEEIQLGMEYAPNPVFHAGSPETASGEVVGSFSRRYEPIRVGREQDAQRHANRHVKV